MKIGIIGAMEQEVAYLRSAMHAPQLTEIAGCQIYQGTINGVDVALLQSGIGKTAAAIGTTLLLQLTKPDYIINTGSAGGVDSRLNIGDIVISNEVRYHDADVTAFGYEKGQMPANPPAFIADSELAQLARTQTEQAGFNAVSGLICSGDIFVNGEQAINQIRHDFPTVIAVEMEAAAIAQTCHAFNVPFVVIRAISDVADKVSHISFDDFLPLAAKQSSEIVLNTLNMLANREKEQE